MDVLISLLPILGSQACVQLRNCTLSKCEGIPISCITIPETIQTCYVPGFTMEGCGQGSGMLVKVSPDF